MKRSGHPFVSVTYINGYVKDIPLYQKELADVIYAINQSTNTSKLIRRQIRL